MNHASGDPGIPECRLDLEAIDPVVVDPEAIAGFRSEDAHMALAVPLLVEITKYAALSSGVMGETRNWNRTQAVLGGHAVRLVKLLSAFLDQTCQHRRETSFILARLVFETALNERYILKNLSEELVADYVSYSLRNERRLRDLIQTNISVRGGASQPIEERMLSSISRAERAAEINLDTINPNDRSAWGGKSIYAKATDVGWQQAYLAVFGGGSHSIHGNWQDLYEYHLEWDEELGFSPKPQWSHPRPQPVYALGLIVLDTVRDHFAYFAGQAFLQAFEPVLSDVEERLWLANDAHEAYLSSRSLADAHPPLDGNATRT